VGIPWDAAVAKVAQIVLFEVTVVVVVLGDPANPPLDHPVKTYPSAGVAFTVTDVPETYVGPAGLNVIVPPEGEHLDSV
jgi:hypothetical protein